MTAADRISGVRSNGTLLGKPAVAPVAKSLDQKLAAIHADPSGSREFIIADAKDADMAFGLAAPGSSPEHHAGEGRFRSLEEYRQQIRDIVHQGIVDIMLMSTSTSDALALGERLFDNSHVTPAVRANDTTDIWVARGAAYAAEASRPFRTSLLDHAQCGHVDCAPEERTRGANLGLYSVTFNNRLDEDQASLAAYRVFREEAERKGFRHFLEVFDPNAPQGLSPEQVPTFVNDNIARALAGVAGAGRPLFLKVVYHGPRAMEDLVAYDPHLVVGILGGAAGTTYDAFKLIAEAQKHGARVALFGRKINSAESPLAFVQFLRLIVEGAITPEEAVPAYHAVLAKLNIKPVRSLADDSVLQTAVMSYSGRAQASVPASVASAPTAQRSSSSARLVLPRASLGTGSAAVAAASKPATSTCGYNGKPVAATSARPNATGDACSCGCKSNVSPAAATSNAAPVEPDFSKMTTAEKLAFNKARRDRVFGK
ncbi:MAG: hypothetical protein K2Y37_11405 [Pirellulales bacterium]|nr:hypothetical protein [Pirellulales bacterium]